MVLAYQKHSLSKFLFKEKLSPVCPSFEKEKGDQKGGGLIEKTSTWRLEQTGIKILVLALRGCFLEK